MLDFLASSPLLTIMVVVCLGTLLGIIPFGPVKLGPAGALFVGLAVAALDPRLGQNFAVVQSLGLALFVYTVGIASGAAFFRNVRRQLPLMIGAILVLCASVGATMASGLFRHSSCNAATTSAAIRASGLISRKQSDPSLIASSMPALTPEPKPPFSATVR